MKAARKDALIEIQNYYHKIRDIYSYPEQRFFLDEISKDDQDALWSYSHSKHNTKSVVKIHFSCENRVAVFVTLYFNVFMSRKSFEGIYSRKKFTIISESTNCLT